MSFLKKIVHFFFDWKIWVEIAPLVIFVGLIWPNHQETFKWLPATYGVMGSILVFILCFGDMLMVYRGKKPLINYLIWALTLVFSAGLGYYQQGWLFLVLMTVGRVANVFLWNYVARFDK